MKGVEILPLSIRWRCSCDSIFTSDMRQDEMKTLLIGTIHHRMCPHHYWKRNCYGLKNINYTQADIC
jgi:hypothetical protein